MVSEKLGAIDSFSEAIIHTGQHFDQNMSDIFFNEMGLPKPDYNLNINQMSHGQMTAKMMEKIEPILMDEKPNGVLVYGDTNSTLAGSLTAAKLHIPVFHVEAGLRSYNRAMPEEINRVLTDHLSSLLFCPTENAVNILAKEGIQKGVKNCGDVMFDAFLKFKEQIENGENETPEVDSPYVLTTIHRPENTDNNNNLISIFKELNKINEKIRVVLPLHPRTKNKLEELRIKTKVELISPVGYLSMISLLNSAEMVITDSGGLQKEAFFAKKKCITVRNETEWTELIDIGVNRLSAPAELNGVFEGMRANECDFSKKLYGNGNAGKIIVDSMVEYFA
jgi:UDP-GlcNAc3NAcA epimerase